MSKSQRGELSELCDNGDNGKIKATGVKCERHSQLPQTTMDKKDTGGKGVFTWQAHGEFIVSSETICPPITHQAHAGYFLKEFLNSPTYYPPGTWWALFKIAYDSTQWK